MKSPVKRGTGARKAKPDDPEQSKRFEEAARELEAENGGTAFKKTMDQLVPSRQSLS